MTTTTETTAAPRVHKGLAGIVVNTVDRPDAVGASWLFAVFAGLAALGGVASFRAGKGVG